MHSDRTGDRAVDVSPIPSLQVIGRRVVGLGAPISVLIRLEAREVPLLRARLLEGSPGRGDSEEAIEDMVASLTDKFDDEIVVLWPSALAAPVLRDALTAALDTVESSPRDDEGLGALADAVDDARAVLATLRAFLAVDNGGLEQVAL